MYNTCAICPLCTRSAGVCINLALTGFSNRRNVSLRLGVAKWRACGYTCRRREANGPVTGILGQTLHRVYRCSDCKLTALNHRPISASTQVNLTTMRRAMMMDCIPRCAYHPFPITITSRQLVSSLYPMTRILSKMVHRLSVLDFQLIRNHQHTVDVSRLNLGSVQVVVVCAISVQRGDCQCTSLHAYCSLPGALLSLGSERCQLIGGLRAGLESKSNSCT